jgi:hypothetical protein
MAIHPTLFLKIDNLCDDQPRRGYSAVAGDLIDTDRSLYDIVGPGGVCNRQGPPTPVLGRPIAMVSGRRPEL